MPCAGGKPVVKGALIRVRKRIVFLSGKPQSRLLKDMMLCCVSHKRFCFIPCDRDVDRLPVE
jgi:hypothetical protein